MEEIRLFIDGLEIELKEDVDLSYLGKIPELWIAGKKYVPTKEIPNKCLFISEDGVEIFENDMYWKLMEDFSYHIVSNVSYQRTKQEKYFSSEDKVRLYVMLYKPIPISYKDIEKILNERSSVAGYIYSRFEQYFKEKINP